MIKVVIIELIKVTEDGLVGQLRDRLKEIDNLIGQGRQQKGGHTDIQDLGQEKDIESLSQGHQIEIRTIETENQGQGQKKERDIGGVQGQNLRKEAIKVTVLVVVQ